MQNYQAFWSSGPNSFDPNCFNKPQVIGEGDVVSTVSPEGIIQYFFLPISQWMPYISNPTVKPSYSYCNPNIISWFVRSINSPLPAVFSRPYQTSSLGPLVNPCHDQDYNVNTYNSGFQLKFHNDNWTSTTDLYYFCPSARLDWIPAQQKESAAVQVEIPVVTKNICHCQVLCNSLCHCTLKDHQGERKTDVRSCDHENTDRRMSVEDVCFKSKHKLPKHCTKKCYCNNKSNANNTSSCGCGKETKCLVTSDKLVTTFIDQKTGCNSEVGRETQTPFRNNSFTNTTAARSCDDRRKRKQYKVSFANSVNTDLIPKSSETVTCKSGCCSENTSDSCICNSETE